MTYPTVTISGNDYDVFADVDAADIYAVAATHADAWRAATADVKARNLVTATRTLDRQSWLGEKNDSDQALQWPRKNTEVEGVEDNVVPPEIIDACIELAIALADGSDIQDQANVSRKEQSISIGGAISVSYFRGAESSSSSGAPQRFPQIIQELIGRFLTSSVSNPGAAAPHAFGVDETIESVTAQDFSLNQGR